MAPLPQNSTAIYYVDYSFAPGQLHTLAFRFGGSAGVDGAQLFADNFLTALQPNLTATWQVVGARVQSAGANVSLPSAAPGIVGGGGPSLTGQDYPRFLSFIGRGKTSGRRVRITVFGVTLPASNDYRFHDGEVAGPTAALGVLYTAPVGCPITVAGDQPYWQPYANTGYNSYWERQQRG